MAESEVKGSVFYSTFLSIEQLDGAEAAARVLRQLQGAVGERLRLRSIVDSAWYPVAWLEEIDDAIVAGLSQRDSDVLYRIATTGVLRDLRGMYRIFVKILTPQMVISSAPRLFKQYYRGGEIIVGRSEPGLAMLGFSHWDGFGPAMWSRCLGGCEAAVQACGADGVRGRWVAGGHTSDARLEVTWTLAR